MATSRLGGVPTVLQPPGAVASGELSLGLSGDCRAADGEHRSFADRTNRRIYHGVPKVFDGTAPSGLELPPGRLSITIRETGLS